MNVALQEKELPVRLRFEQPLSDEDLLRFCAANESLRIERNQDGELLVMSPAGGGASRKNSNIIYQLTKWAEETNSGVAFDSNGGFTLPDGSMRSPDAAWIPWSRWNALSAEEQEKFLPLCPDFVIELRSPSDRLEGLRAKMNDWIANGTELAWLIDPEREAVEIYRPGRDPEIQEGHSAVYGEGPVGGFVLELARIWG